MLKKSNLKSSPSKNLVGQRTYEFIFFDYFDYNVSFDFVLFLIILFEKFLFSSIIKKLSIFQNFFISFHVIIRIAAK